MYILTSDNVIMKARSIYQANIYDGFVEGLPTSEGNSRLVEKYVKKASDDFYDCNIKLIRPVENPIEHTGNYPFGKPAQIPPIVCVARFTAPGNDPLFYGALGVVWFQQKFALPIDEGVLEQLKSVVWYSEAKKNEV